MKVWILALFSLSVFANPLMDKQNFTLSRDLVVRGPIYNDITPTQYHQEVFRIILEEAQVMAQEYIETQDHFAYWTFMMGALVIPYHEGRNTHFREIENYSGACRKKSNNGSILKNRPETKKIFNSFFKIKGAELIPDCKEMVSDNLLLQILHGHDGTDIGIMQINIRWHEKNYISTNSFSDVSESVRYGLGLYKKGFEGLYRNPKNFPCLYQHKKINQKRLIHAAWAGTYNSGNLAASCRFTQPSNKWAGNDEKFNQSLNTIYSMISKKIMNKLYPLPPLEAKLFKKIISNSLIATQNETIVADYLKNVPTFTPDDDVKSEKELLTRLNEKIHAIGAAMATTSQKINVRSEAPKGSTLGPLTGHVLETGTEIMINDVYEKEKTPWFHITAPFEGWVHGQHVEIE